MDIGSILLGVALLLVVAFIVARPLLEQARPGAIEAGQADDLQSERERVLTALRDLDFDHATGKLLDDDYTAQRTRLLAEGAAVLKQLDELAPDPDQAAELPPTDSDSEIEQAIARRRARPTVTNPRRGVDAEIEATVAERRQTARFCSQCGRPLRPEDRFCGTCGAAVSAPEAARR